MKRCTVLLLALAACAHENPEGVRPDVGSPGGDAAALEAMELGRTLHADSRELLALAHASDPEVRAHALEVIARLQRPETAPAVLEALADPQLAQPAAFAAGQLGLAWRPLPKASLQQLARAVEAALPRAQRPEDRAALLEALGKLAQPESAGPLVAALADADAGVRRAAALALGLLAYATKGAAPSLAAIDPLNAMLIHDPDAGARYGAAYALMRLKKPEARPGLTYGLKDADANVRAVCARGLGDVGTEPEYPYLLERLGDADLSVRVESARALGKLASRCKDEKCPAAAASRQALVALAAAYSPQRPETGSPLLALVQEKLPASALTEVKLAPAMDHDRAVVGCYLAAARDRVRTDAATPALEECDPTPELLAWRSALEVRTLADSPADPKVKLSALLRFPVQSALAGEAVDDGLGELKLDTPEVRARLLADLRSVDWGTTLSAADAAGKLGLTDAVPDLHRALTVASVNEQHDAMASILGTLAALHAPDAQALALEYADDPRATVRFGALDALEQMKVPAPDREPRPLDFHLARLDRDRVARLTTTRGEIRMRLHAGSFTAQNFLELAERGYFDQLTFHRVVPGFVVQGGDPRGDGAGGPGYSIPCEIDRSRYLRGAVGMALAGKDTGGSQLFITLAPQPHLEGRYTVFAEVISGMEIADQLMEGDRILKVELEP